MQIRVLNFETFHCTSSQLRAQVTSGLVHYLLECFLRLWNSFMQLVDVTSHPTGMGHTRIHVINIMCFGVGLYTSAGPSDMDNIVLPGSRNLFWDLMHGSRNLPYAAGELSAGLSWQGVRPFG